MIFNQEQFDELIKKNELSRMVLLDGEGNLDLTDIYCFSDTPEIKYVATELSNLDIELKEIPYKED